MVRETKWGDVKVIEKVVCLGEVTVIPQHISTAIKMISVDSLTDTCLDSQLHHFVVSVREAALGIAYSIQLENRPRQVDQTVSIASKMLSDQMITDFS